MKLEKSLPNDWKIEKLGRLCGIVYGKGLLTKNLKENGFPVFGANGIIGFNDKFLYKETKVLISCRGAYSGKINFSPPQCYVTNNSLVLDIKNENELDKNYLFYSLGAASKTKLVTGTAQPQVTINNAVELEIPLPPLKTQQLIVSKIEELFSELDKGIENLKTAKQQLKTYRQAVLKWAFEKPIESIPVKLMDVCYFITKGTTPSKDSLYFLKGEIPFLKVYNLTFDGTLDFSKDPTYVSKETHNNFLKRSIVYPEDVLMNIVGPPLGKVSIVPHTHQEWNMNQAMVRFRCKDLLHNKFLLYFLLSENTIRTYSRKAKATVGQFNLTLEICRDIEIFLPPIEKQYLIIQEIESRLSIVDKMEESINQSLQQAEALRQSILKKAFEGKLV